MTKNIKWLRLLFVILVFLLLIAAVMRTPQFRRLSYPYAYREIIEEYAAEYRVDPLLVAAVIREESKFNADAVSRKGALGLMQLMPSTAQWIAPQVGIINLTDEMLLDPEINIQLGTWYLANLFKEFDGRHELVIASYNAGRGKVASWLRDDVWTGRYEDREQIPFGETRIFLQRVIGSYRNYQELYR
ncbi:lytic transglycosylase domain-containing protein [Dethiobacter alkaliphilus]|uniref:lytic transglycosylase domain-containing protein n=1 Tax=Dethiobacter alkaliphilus TaxID=427926 RepID=UPI002227E614|nr:lytic transglycosylase domain-containing protein [Dethiobacter alkaliphilus]MCW3490420.1 lytic transglycosylase domain-containing protein [Dethiobacter alkaliphilus]